MDTSERRKDLEKRIASHKDFIAAHEAELAALPKEPMELSVRHASTIELFVKDGVVGERIVVQVHRPQCVRYDIDPSAFARHIMTALPGGVAERLIDALEELTTFHNSKVHNLLDQYRAMITPSEVKP